MSDIEELNWETDPETLDQRGRVAAGLGIGAMFLAMTGFCSCYIGFIAALVLGGIGVFQARSIQNEEPKGEALAYANVALWTGIMAVIFSALILALIMAYLAVYIIMIFVIVGNGI